ncbi:MAG TPA: hypothetical protein VHE33_10625, partial [Acidobacteriaceae bacterium]|nr:hypothetical protein [Acidobacteriaceae bacterium]
MLYLTAMTKGGSAGAGSALGGLWLGLCVLLLVLGARAQDTAYPPQDAQIPGPAAKADAAAWRADVQRWRLERRMRMGYDGGKSTRPELGWTQRNFICAQMMIEERDFYDPE